MTIESAFKAMATMKPMIKTKTWERRLYHPETRSIELLYQFSMFSRAFAASFPAASTRAVSALLTSSGKVSMFSRSVGTTFGLGGGCGAGAWTFTTNWAPADDGGVAPLAPDGSP